MLFAVEAAKRWASDGIITNALMPGRIRTALQRYVENDLTPELQKVFDEFARKTTEQGASTSVLLAASPLIAGVTGKYFEDNNEVLPHVDGQDGGVAEYALDPESATRLWDLSEKLLAS